MKFGQNKNRLGLKFEQNKNKLRMKFEQKNELRLKFKKNRNNLKKKFKSVWTKEKQKPRLKIKGQLKTALKLIALNKYL